MISKLIFALNMFVPVYCLVILGVRLMLSVIQVFLSSEPQLYQNLLFQDVQTFNRPLCIVLTPMCVTLWM